MIQIPLHQQILKCKVCLNSAKISCKICKLILYCSQQHLNFDLFIHQMQCSLYSPKYKSESQLKQQNKVIQNDSNKRQINSIKNIQDQNKNKNKQINQFLLDDSKAYDRKMITKLKKLLQYRNYTRNNIIYLYLKKQIDESIGFAKRLLINSQKIILYFDNKNTRQLLEYWQNIKTTKFLQQIQHLMDVCLLCKIYQIIQKKQQIRLIIERYQFPQHRKSKIASFKSKDQINQFNIWRQQITKYTSVLKSLILISSSMKLITTVQKIYDVLINLVKQSYRELELSTIYFQLGVWYMNNQILDKAKTTFLLCKKNRQMFGQTVPLSQVIFNLGLCQYYLNNKFEAINLIQESLLIKIDKISDQPIEFRLQLQTLGKIYMQMGNFQKSYKRLFQCFLINKRFKIKSKEKIRIEILLITLYRNLNRLLQSEEYPQKQKNSLSNLIRKLEKQVFIYNDFEQYQLNSVSQIYFKLKIDKQLFDSLNSDQINLISSLAQQVQKLKRQNAIKYVKQSIFYKSLSKGQKQMLYSSNPDIKLR